MTPAVSASDKIGYFYPLASPADRSVLTDAVHPGLEPRLLVGHHPIGLGADFLGRQFSGWITQAHQHDVPHQRRCRSHVRGNPFRKIHRYQTFLHELTSAVDIGSPIELHISQGKPDITLGAQAVQPVLVPSRMPLEPRNGLSGNSEMARLTLVVLVTIMARASVVGKQSVMTGGFEAQPVLHQLLPQLVLYQ